jgi:hypothetical protein
VAETIRGPWHIEIEDEHLEQLAVVQKNCLLPRLSALEQLLTLVLEPLELKSFSSFFDSE